MKKKNSEKIPKFKLRKHLNADALFKTIKQGFEKIPDHRKGPVKISLADALMSAFAMFSIKEPSLLAFDEKVKAGNHNLNSVYNIVTIPCDTRMREVLDEVLPQYLLPLFKDIFRPLQRGKALEQLVCMDGYYLLSLDGTGFYSSSKIGSESCLEKKSKTTGEIISYYQQMMGGVIVHPDFKEVIPLAPEMIIKQDGDTKNDCERNAAKRFFEQLRKDHPHLPLIITEDALSPNAPHIGDLEKYNLRYILGVKPGDHAFLFEHVNEATLSGKTTEYECPDETEPGVTHYFNFVNGVPLNKSNQDVSVNFIELGSFQQRNKTF